MTDQTTPKVKKSQAEVAASLRMRAARAELRAKEAEELEKERERHLTEIQRIKAKYDPSANYVPTNAVTPKPNSTHVYEPASTS